DRNSHRVSGIGHVDVVLAVTFAGAWGVKVSQPRYVGLVDDDAVVPPVDHVVRGKHVIVDHQIVVLSVGIVGRINIYSVAVDNGVRVCGVHVSDKRVVRLTYRDAVRGSRAPAAG